MLSTVHNLDKDVPLNHSAAYAFLCASGVPVTITKDESIEVGFEKNMRGVIVAHDFVDNCEAVVLDASAPEFKEHNLHVAQPTYYDEKGEPSLTVFESGNYNNVEAIFPLNGKYGFMFTSDDEVVNRILDRILQSGAPNLAQMMLDVHGRVSPEEQTETFDDEHPVFMTGAPLFSEYPNEVIPLFTVIKVEKEDIEGDEVLDVSSADAFKHWNDGIKQKVFSNLYSPKAGDKRTATARTLQVYLSPEDLTPEKIRDLGLVRLSNEQQEMLLKIGTRDKFLEECYTAIKNEMAPEASQSTPASVFAPSERNP